MTSLKKNRPAWTSVKAVRAQVLRLWERGDLLRAVLHQTLSASNTTHLCEPGARFTEFPLRLILKKPSSSEYGQHYAEVREWIKALSGMRYTRIESIETRHPQLGRNQVPVALWVDSLADAIALIGKRQEVDGFVEMVRRALAQPLEYHPVLINWIARSPVKPLALAAQWERLLLVFSTMASRSQDTLYLRQLSVPGVDTKFIEQHRRVLGEWLDASMPAEFIQHQYKGSRGFAKRFGFQDKPVRIRLRSLDSALPLVAYSDQADAHAQRLLNTADVTLDHAVLCAANPRHSHVIITENEINYLCLPALANTVALFGSGYGLQSIGSIEWLSQRKVFYWGDIDTHGFAILNELRASLPAVNSLMMDSDTLLAHESVWVNESKPANRLLSHLSDSESSLYKALVENRYGVGVRLEQEQIDYQYVLTRLRAAGWDVTA